MAYKPNQRRKELIPDKKKELFSRAAFTLLVAALGYRLGTAQAQGVSTEKIDASFLEKEGIALHGKIVGARQVTDHRGHHILVLISRTGPSRISPRAQDERTDLLARYYSRRRTKWELRWTIVDGIDCPGLDHTAEFFSEDTAVTDLDENGIAEVTIAYKLFCGGGIEPAVLKIILRQENQKFAMRGTTKIIVPGETPFGGDATYDKDLYFPKNLLFLRHIESVRGRVVEHKY